MFLIMSIVPSIPELVKLRIINESSVYIGYIFVTIVIVLPYYLTYVVDMLLEKIQDEKTRINAYRWGVVLMVINILRVVPYFWTTVFTVLGFILFVLCFSYLNEKKKLMEKNIESIKRGWCHFCNRGVDFKVEHFGKNHGHITCPKCGHTQYNRSLDGSRFDPNESDLR